jgi:site-specific DNA-methyltransferase (adenine-specific)
VTPYYEHAGITIYHGDCHDVIADLWAGVGLLLTDPPYGISHTSGGGTGGKWHNVRHQGMTIANDDRPFDPAHLLGRAPVILWGANFYSDKLPGGGWLVWDKRPGIEDMEFNRSDAEVAFFSESRTVKTFRHLWHGLCRATEIGCHLHPTQKPVALMKWCIGLVPSARLVLDPYAGSGPTLRAAKDLGINAIGIEIEERYCEIAAKRLSQEVLPLEDVS